MELVYDIRTIAWTHFSVFILDCDLSEVFHKSANYPDWSPCLSFRNESDQCGKEKLKNNQGFYYKYPRFYSPVKAYERILTKDHWVCDYFCTLDFLFKIF